MNTADLLAANGNHFLGGPRLISRKKRVSKTVYWYECPKCGALATGDYQDTREPKRTFKPCGCVVEWKPELPNNQHRKKENNG